MLKIYYLVFKRLTMDISTFLKQSYPYFRESDLKEQLVEIGQTMRIPANTLILDEGSYVKTIPIVLSGLLRVLRRDDMREIMLYYVNPLESCIMSISSCFKNEKSLVKAITEEDTELLLIPARLMNDWQHRYPSFNQFIVDLYRKRFEDMIEAFDAVAFQRMDERLLSYLRNKAQVLRTQELQITHQALANELGTAREVISRFLKILENQGKVILSRGKIKIIDLDL